MEILVLLLVVAIGYLLFGQSKLKKQVNRLEQMFAESKVELPTPPMTARSDRSDPTTTADVNAGPWQKSGTQTRQNTATPADGSIPQSDPGDLEPDVGKPPRTFVFHRDNLRNAGAWLARNWFLAIAALSLALAGVFLVQYGVENGLLSPFWRVMGAAFFGAALIWGGEFIRRRSGDDSERHSAYLPSTFSGAGLVALFAAVLAARQLYGLIGPEGAMVYLVMVSAVAVVLGWFYGPFLAVVGILGSVAAPFLVGGQSESPGLFFYYFALIAGVALLVDAIKRWAWVSVFALIFTFGAAWFIWDQGAGDEHALAFALIAALAAAIVPGLKLWPQQQGATALMGGVSAAFPRGKAKRNWSEFPTRIAAGAFAGAVAFALLVAERNTGQVEVWLAIATLSLLFVTAVIWFQRAPALDDLTVVAALGFLAVLVLQALDYGAVFRTFQAGFDRPPETAPPIDVSLLTILALVGSGLACWRSLGGGGRAQIFAAGSALFAPLVLVVLEILWQPSPVLGAGRWAAHAMGIAVAMVLFAGLVGRRDGADKRRVAYFALAALTMIAFALIMVLSSAALTVALAVMVLAAALIDRRLDLPLLGVFVQAGTIVVGWRLVLAPGLPWGADAPGWELALAYGGSALLLAAAWIILAARARINARLTVESGIWAILGVLGCLVLYRMLGGDIESHWAVSLLSSVWLMLMLVQIYRLQGSAWLRWVRIGLASVYGLLALAGFAIVLLVFNPLGPLFSSHDPVIGPPVLDSLLVAFGVPALILAVGVWKIPNLRPWFRGALVSLSALFALAYVGLEVRRFWQGRDLSQHGVSQGELYSYTIVLLLVSVGLLFLAFNRRSVGLRRVATLGIAATIAKVFLIDMAGLAGLMRVASFLGLGLSLAGLGWIYRQMAAQWARGQSEPDQQA